MKEQEISYPLTNTEFLKVLANAFYRFLDSGTSRSTAKLKPLHGAIAKDISHKLGKEYTICAQGFGENKEATIDGRYIPKRVDITIQKDNEPVAGIAVKFVMQNYSQNSNNYFENMLGETANIRVNGYPYFQIFIILDKIPYYKRNKNLQKWESFTAHNIEKYVTLSRDNIDRYFHTPNKTLIYVLHIPDKDDLENLADYMNYYKNSDFEIQLSENHYSELGAAVIINDYETFKEKLFHTIKSL